MMRVDSIFRFTRAMLPRTQYACLITDDSATATPLAAGIPAEVLEVSGLACRAFLVRADSLTTIDTTKPCAAIAFSRFQRFQDVNLAIIEHAGRCFRHSTLLSLRAAFTRIGGDLTLVERDYRESCANPARMTSCAHKSSKIPGGFLVAGTRPFHAVQSSLEILGGRSSSTNIGSHARTTPHLRARNR